MYKTEYADITPAAASGIARDYKPATDLPKGSPRSFQWNMLRSDNASQAATKVLSLMLKNKLPLGEAVRISNCPEPIRVMLEYYHNAQTGMVVIKRDGDNTVPFNLLRIFRAVSLAEVAVRSKSAERIHTTHLPARILFDVLDELIRQHVLSCSVEQIQDMVEDSIFNFGERELFKTYALYRRAREQARALTVQDVVDYLARMHKKERENANMVFSVQGMNCQVSGHGSEIMWLDRIYPEVVKYAHEKGRMHIHDLSMIAPYCVGWDFYDVLLRGFGGVPGKTVSAPPKHFRSALGIMWNFLYTLQGECAGAQALSNVDTLMAPFIRYDQLSYDEVKQGVQELVFNLNVPTRTGFQTPFTNITLDLNPHANYRNMVAIIGGKPYPGDLTYGEFQEEMDMFNRAFCEVMCEGDAAGQVFSFPIPTYNIDKEFDWEHERNIPIWEMTRKYGIPYFANFVNSDMSPEDSRSMCPMVGETRVTIRDNFNGLFHTDKISRLFGRIYHPECFPKTEFINPDISVPTPTGEWAQTEIRSYPTDDCYRLILSSDLFEIFDARHEQPVKSGIGAETRVITIADLKIGDYIPMMTDAFMDRGGRGLNPYASTPVPWFADADNPNMVWVRVVKKKLDFAYRKGAALSVFCFSLKEPAGDHLFVLDSGVVTHNCRLRLDLTELNKRGGGMFGSNPLTGSLGVVTLNLPQLGYRVMNQWVTPELVNEQTGLGPDSDSQKIRLFYQELDDIYDIAVRSLEIKRRKIEEFTENGLYPFIRVYLEQVKIHTGKFWTNHFSTIGMLGMNELCEVLLGCHIGTALGKRFAIRVMHHLRDRMVITQKETGNLYNLEATPAEGASYRLMGLDREQYPGYLESIPRYSNSTQLPVNYTDDIFVALEHQDDLQSLYTGGTVQHLFLGEALGSWEIVRDLVRSVCTTMKMPYISITPTFSVCQQHGYINGETPECPTCGGAADVYSRVVGFLRPVKNWNDTKQEEFAARVPYQMKGESSGKEDNIA